MPGGARMRYPTAFVLVAADTQQELLRQNHGSLPPTSPPPPLSTRGPTSPPPSPKATSAPPPPPEPTIRLMAKAAYMDPTYQPMLAPDTALALGASIIDRVWLDASATSGANNAGHAAAHAAAASPAPPSSVGNR